MSGDKQQDPITDEEFFCNLCGGKRTVRESGIVDACTSKGFGATCSDPAGTKGEIKERSRKKLEAAMAARNADKPPGTKLSFFSVV